MVTGQHSLKVKTLEAAIGRPWTEIALEWASKPYTQQEIAEKWTVIASTVREGVRYTNRDVSQIIQLARRQRAETPSDLAESAAA